MVIMPISNLTMPICIYIYYGSNKLKILFLTPSNGVCLVLLIDSFNIKLFLSYFRDIFVRRVEVDVGQEEATIESILEELAHEIHASVGVKMHRLGVCEWEVKLWMASAGKADGAWRVVVTNVTGHTCIVHVSVCVI